MSPDWIDADEYALDRHGTPEAIEKFPKIGYVGKIRVKFHRKEADANALWYVFYEEGGGENAYSEKAIKWPVIPEKDDLTKFGNW